MATEGGIMENVTLYGVALFTSYQMASQPSSETIHSGHFMASNVHELKTEDDEEIDVVSDSGMEPPDPEVRPDTKDDKPVTFYKFGPVSTRSIAIDVSLSKLSKCIQIAYDKGKLTTPKWKNFKGLKLDWKDRIRLNNVIWRAWYMQFVLNNKPKFCFFSICEEDYWHNRSEANIVEGMYWKRRLETVCAQYTRWRHFYFKHGDKREKLAMKQMNNSTGDSGFFVNSFLDDELLFSSTGNLTPPMTFENDDDFTNWFTDTLFSSLNQPYMFPNPKQFPQSDNADLVQPGLIQLQPSVEEIMASLESNTGSYLTDDGSSSYASSAGSQLNVGLAAANQQKSQLGSNSAPLTPSYVRASSYCNVGVQHADCNMTPQQQQPQQQQPQYRFIGSPGGAPYSCSSSCRGYANRGGNGASSYRGSNLAGSDYASKTMVRYGSNESSAQDDSGFGSKTDGYSGSSSYATSQDRTGSQSDTVHGGYRCQAPYGALTTASTTTGNNSLLNTARTITYVTKTQSTQSSIIAPPNVVAPRYVRTPVTSPSATLYANTNNVAVGGIPAPYTQTAPLTAELLLTPTTTAMATRKSVSSSRQCSDMRQTAMMTSPSMAACGRYDDVASKRPVIRRSYCYVSEASNPPEAYDEVMNRPSNVHSRFNNVIYENSNVQRCYENAGPAFSDVISGTPALTSRHFNNIMTSATLNDASNAAVGQIKNSRTLFLPPLNVEVGANSADTQTQFIGVSPKRTRYSHSVPLTTTVAVRSSSAVNATITSSVVSFSSGGFCLIRLPSTTSLSPTTALVSSNVESSTSSAASISSSLLPTGFSSSNGATSGGDSISVPSGSRAPAVPFLSTSVAAAAQTATYYGLPAAAVMAAVSTDHEGLRPITSCCSPYAKTFSPKRPVAGLNAVSPFALVAGSFAPSTPSSVSPLASTSLNPSPPSSSSPIVCTASTNSPSAISPSITSPSLMSSTASGVIRPIPMSLNRPSPSLGSSRTSIVGGGPDSAFSSPSPLSGSAVSPTSGLSNGRIISTAAVTSLSPSSLATTAGLLAAVSSTPAPSASMLLLQSFSRVQLPLMDYLPMPSSPTCLSLYASSPKETQQPNDKNSEHTSTVDFTSSSIVQSSDVDPSSSVILRRSSAPETMSLAADQLPEPSSSYSHMNVDCKISMAPALHGQPTISAECSVIKAQGGSSGSSSTQPMTLSGRGRKNQLSASTGLTRGTKVGRIVSNTVYNRSA